MRTKCQKFYFVDIFFFKVRLKFASKVMLMYTLNTLWKIISKCVKLVPNLTHFENFFKVRWYGPKFNALWKFFQNALPHTTIVVSTHSRCDTINKDRVRTYYGHLNTQPLEYWRYLDFCLLKNVSGHSCFFSFNLY